jgi:hypothetical protein
VLFEKKHPKTFFESGSVVWGNAFALPHVPDSKSFFAPRGA